MTIEPIKTLKMIKRELTRIHVKPVAHFEIKLKQNTETACDSFMFESVSLAYLSTCDNANVAETSHPKIV